jgi:hypothetical protein
VLLSFVYNIVCEGTYFLLHVPLSVSVFKCQKLCMLGWYMITPLAWNTRLCYATYIVVTSWLKWLSSFDIGQDLCKPHVCD